QRLVRQPLLLRRTLHHNRTYRRRPTMLGAAITREDRDVIPGSFAYHRPTSVKEAVALLADFGEEGRALAGGHSLIPMMKLRLATPANLVDLAGIADLKGVRSDGNDVVIGAMTTQHDLIGSDLLAAKVPILRETS